MGSPQREREKKAKKKEEEKEEEDEEEEEGLLSKTRAADPCELLTGQLTRQASWAKSSRREQLTAHLPLAQRENTHRHSKPSKQLP